MKIPKFTKNHHLFFCLLARHIWVERIKPKDVVKGLARWNCGTQACFGGHLTSWPEFHEIVKPELGLDENEPLRWRLERAGVPAVWLDTLLFGDEYMFAARGQHPADPWRNNLSDHATVLRRLDWRINQLLEQS